MLCRGRVGLAERTLLKVTEGEKAISYLYPKRPVQSITDYISDSYRWSDFESMIKQNSQIVSLK